MLTSNELLRADPEGCVMAAPRPTFLDEVQRAGDPLILAIRRYRNHWPDG